MLTKVKSTDDAELDKEAWAKTSAEFEAGTLLGPYYSMKDIPAKRVQLLPRFPIWEKNGGAVNWKVRMVDDCKQGRQNIGAATSAAHRPADLDMWVLLMRAVGMKWPERLAAFTSDFKAAYRQLAACPLQGGDIWCCSMGSSARNADFWLGAQPNVRVERVTAHFFEVPRLVLPRDGHLFRCDFCPVRR